MEQKVCSKCNLTKSITEFYQRKTHRKDEYYERCKECFKKRGREYYHKNHSRQLFLAKKRKQKYIKLAKKIVNDLKNNPCSDCGYLYPPYVMDFDHREGEIKIGSIANFVRSKSSNIEKLRQEIIKCDLVCANCHRIRTYSRIHASVAKVVKAGA